MNRRPSTRSSPFPLLAVALAAGILVAACGGGASPSPSTAPTEPPVTSPPAVEPSDGIPTEPATALPGTAWNVTRYAGEAGALVAVLPATTVTLEFGVGGRFGGTAGCNSFGADYTVDEATGTIGFGMMSTTLMLCEPPALMAQEGAMVAALETTTAYAIVDGRLQLLDASGAILVEAEQTAAAGD
jgi:heat shock protein HslJ